MNAGPSRPQLSGAVGAGFEKSAETYLRRRGLKTLERNYRCRRGEIDLVMTHGDYLVFVEVRYRASREFGDPLETITPRKQRRIIAAATHFLAANERLGNRPRKSRPGSCSVCRTSMHQIDTIWVCPACDLAPAVH